MLEELDPGRHYRAKIENGFAYVVHCAIEAAFSRRVWVILGLLLACYASFETGYYFGQTHMRARMIKAYNLVTDCEVIEIPTIKPNTTELYQLCG